MQTARRMRALVNQSLTDPVVINTAKSIVRFTLPRDYPARIGAVRDFLVSHFLFCKDPYGVELLHTPRYLLDTIATKFYVMADCDDASILSAALGKALGLRARFVLVGFRGSSGPFAHVYTELATPNGTWYAIDTTRPPGKDVPDPSRVSVMEV